MNRYLALLRGINVGGKNRIKMSDLQACFEAAGFENVRTYIQSGNVLFGSAEPDPVSLTSRVEAALSATFDAEIPVVIRSTEQLQAVITHAPEGFGSLPDAYRYDVIFLKEPLAAAEALQWVRTKPGVDEVFAGNGVLYFSRLISRAGQSRLSRIVSTPIYQSITVRNWNTTTKLARMILEP